MGTVLSLHMLVMIRVHGKNSFRHIGYLFPLVVFSQYGLVILYKAFFVRTWGYLWPKPHLKRLNLIILEMRLQVASEEIIKGQSQSIMTSPVEDVYDQQQALTKNKPWQQ